MAIIARPLGVIYKKKQGALARDQNSSSHCLKKRLNPGEAG
jgi:hypothetical protein